MAISNSVTGADLEAMYINHTRISERNGEFKWLLDGHLAADTSAHPVNCPESRVLRLSSTGALLLCVSSHKRVLLNDHTLYYGTYKEWLASILGYNMFNPVKTYRMVCGFNLVFLLIYYFSWYICT